jgi:uncharacterized membrane protein
VNKPISFWRCFWLYFISACFCSLAVALLLAFIGGERPGFPFALLMGLYYLGAAIVCALYALGQHLKPDEKSVPNRQPEIVQDILDQEIR